MWIVGVLVVVITVIIGVVITFGEPEATSVPVVNQELSPEELERLYIEATTAPAGYTLSDADMQRFNKSTSVSGNGGMTAAEREAYVKATTVVQ